MPSNESQGHKHALVSTTCRGSGWEVLSTQKCLINFPVTHLCPHEPLLQGRAARAWNSDQVGPEGPHVPPSYPSLEPHLGFLLVFKDHILGSWRRKRKGSIIWKLGVGLHNPWRRRWWEGCQQGLGPGGGMGKGGQARVGWRVEDSLSPACWL